MIKLTKIILTIFILSSCGYGLMNKPTQTILLFKDKDGIYQFDPITGKEKIIYKATDKQIFLEEPYYRLNDTLTFGIKGDLTYTDTSNYSIGEKYFKDYVSVDINSGENWLSRKILYEVSDYNQLKIKTQIFDKQKNIISQKDSSTTFKGTSTTYKGVVFNEFKPRFYSESTIDDKKVFSSRGCIYLTVRNDTTKIVDYQGNFDAKFGSGYFQPQLDPTGQFVVYRYLPGFLNFKKKSTLERIDLNTKKITRIKTGDFCKPTFSKDGKFILFRRNEKQGKNDVWYSEIYILELETNKVWKIGEADIAYWED